LQMFKENIYWNSVHFPADSYFCGSFTSLHTFTILFPCLTSVQTPIIPYKLAIPVTISSKIFQVFMHIIHSLLYPCYFQANTITMYFLNLKSLLKIKVFILFVIPVSEGSRKWKFVSISFIDTVVFITRTICCKVEKWILQIIYVCIWMYQIFWHS
jgi:hypothetical protein